MYIFANRSLGMSKGKFGAQTGHAAVEAYRLGFIEENGGWFRENGITRNWREVGGHYAKVVLHAEDDTEMLIYKQYIEDRGFKTALIIDEGRTEVRPHSITAMGIEVVDKDDPHVAATFGDFKTYREPKAPKKTLFSR